MARRSKKSLAEPKQIDWELVAKAFAKTVADGDFVNFRLLFSPSSPARSESPECLETAKYAYLRPDEAGDNTATFLDSLRLVQQPAIWRHIEQELAANRPPQLPWQLVLRLADNAVRRGKYTIASQAYEMLRIRPRMQDEFFRQADDALDKNDLRGAVKGYLTATGLEYNYAAFPEPLPVVPDFQQRALVLHGVYPERPEDCVALQEPDLFVRTALSYLLLSPSAAARLEQRPPEVLVAFLKELVAQQDPSWRDFAARFRETFKMADSFRRQMAHAGTSRDATSALVDQIEGQQAGDPRSMAQTLVGHEIAGGEWWQYLKELAYDHPAAVLFVMRQVVGEFETLVPCLRADSPVPSALGLTG